MILIFNEKNKILVLAEGKKKNLKYLVLLMACFIAVNAKAENMMTDTEYLYKLISGNEVEHITAVYYVWGSADMYLSQQDALGSEIKCKDFNPEKLAISIQHLYNRSEIYKNMPSYSLITAAVEEFCEIKPKKEISRIVIDNAAHKLDKYN